MSRRRSKGKPSRRSGGRASPGLIDAPESPAPKETARENPRPRAADTVPASGPDQAFITFAVALLGVVAVGLLTGDGGTELVRAGRIWAEGRSASAEPLWGRTVLWWARAGKVLQFTAGLVVILDLIGPERLRRAGQRTGEQAAAVRTLLVRMRKMPEQTANGAVHLAFGLFLSGVNLFLLVLLATNWSQITRTPTALGPYVVAPVVLLVFLAVGAPERTAGARLPLIGLSWLVAWTLLGLPAAVLDKANPGHILRWLGLLLFIVGFGLDLLGS
jgi:hypothetical protein